MQKSLLRILAILFAASTALAQAEDIGVVWPELETPTSNGPLKNIPLSKVQCKAPQYISESPFFVSSLQKDYDMQGAKNRKITEPLNLTLANGTIVHKGVPAFSIIKLLAPKNIETMTPEEVAKIEASVEVISLPNEEVIKEMQTNRRLVRAANALPIAEEGALGSMRASIMKHVTGFVFKIKDPAILKTFPQLTDILKDTSIHFANKDGLYMARECCTNDATPVCTKQYVFEVNSDERPHTQSKRYYDNSPNDELFSSLFPIPKENLLPLAKILELIQEPQFDFIDFRYFDTRGFVKVPLDPPGTVVNSVGAKVDQMQRGPLRTLHYKSDDSNANDAFGEPTSICAFFQAVKAFNQTCNTANCQIQWGDFYHSTQWQSHADHGEGTCIDVRPMRKREGYDSLSIWAQSKRCKKDEAGVEKCTWVAVPNSAYDRERTREFISKLAAAGGVGKADEDGNTVVSEILFNDRALKGVRAANGHHNHMHVCFPPKSVAVQAACARP